MTIGIFRDLSDGGTRKRICRPRMSRVRLRPEVIGLEHRLVLSTAGTLDTSFGSNGVEQVYFTPLGQTTSPLQSANAVAIDSAGNIVTAGSTNSASPTAPTSATVARLTSAGTPDHNFTPTGKVVVSSALGPPSDFPPADTFSSIVKDSSGNILLNNTTDLIMVGTHTPYSALSTGPELEFSVVRLSSSGGQYSLDTTFGSSSDTDPSDPGIVNISFSAFNPGMNGNTASAALLQPDNTILVTGLSGASNYQIPLARLNFDGTLDTAFGSSTQPGTEFLSVPGLTAGDFINISAMAFQGSTKVILAGLADVNNQPDIVLVRLNTSDDTIDTTFGNDDNGVTLVPVPSGTNISSLAVDPNSGRIVVAGTNTVLAGTNTLAVFTAQGSPDPTFGPSNNGLVTVSGMSVAGIALQSDGSIVMAGSATSAGKQVAALARYTSGGVPDSSFGPNGTGLVTTDILNSGHSAFTAVAIQPNGEIVATGSAGNPATPTSSSPTTVIARYISETTPDINTLSPATAVKGRPSFTLTVNGDDFIGGVNGSTVLWNSTPLTTVFVNATTLTATVPAADVAVTGTASITVRNPGNITSSAKTFTINASQTTPTINWPNPGAITYGTALSATQLDATASVPGSFNYTPNFGTVLPAGSGQTLSVTFTPSDTTDYTGASASVTINVNKLTPTLVVQGGTAIYDGNPHPATFTITGTNGDNLTSLVSLTYNGSTTIPLQPGTYAVAATFPGNGDYNQALGQAVINILAPPHVTGIAIGSRSKKGITSITVSFDQPMNSGSASTIGNYHVFGAVKKKKHTVYTKFIGIKSVRYTGNTATITLSKPYKGVFQVTALGGILGLNGGSTSAPFVVTL
jgi:uncharacterized delta-60 repeat protein